MEDKYETVKLCYTIHKYSSYSANYIPENIMVNSSSDQLSRWFTDSSTPNQFIVLKLKSPSIVESVKFGKYIKAHVSDLKKFQILGGTEEDNLSVLLSSGLKKDNAAETFRLRHRTQEGLYLPVRYLKIVPLQSWGPAYNYSIWYIELMGKNHEYLMHTVLDTIDLRKEQEAVRIILKHLRRRRYKDAFEALSRETGVQLEGPIQARLWNALVENGDYKMAEQILEEAEREGELSWYMSWQPYSPHWRQMSPCSSLVEAVLCCNEPVSAPAICCHDVARPEELQDGSDYSELSWTMGCEPNACCSKPGPRGGHQLVVDSTTGTLYLFGGWNGTEDLDDLWSFDTTTEQWKLLCRHSRFVSGPSPRSCHKMVFDPVNRKLFTLGRYLDNARRIPINMNSDLYSFDVTTGEWSVICTDTAAVGGPRLVFDHQMCIDPDTQTIYVFGGRVLPANSEEVLSPQYSGLYAYYISTNTWELLLSDKHELNAPQPRVSHSMLFHPIQRKLYIFAGQRHKCHLVDLWSVSCDASPEAPQAECLCEAPPAPPPAAGFTQRATLDPHTDTMCVLKGMSKEKDKRVYNTLWVFSFKTMTWSCVYKNDTVTPNEPRPRFAHQLVYDPVRKIHYLFGGNPGNQANPRLRLDDLWALTLTQPSIEKVLNSAQIKIREACYRELCAMGKELDALEYLRNDLRSVMDHSDPDQVTKFQKLASLLFSGGCTNSEISHGFGLTPRDCRALYRARDPANNPIPTDLAHSLSQVLGAEDITQEPPQPYEDIPTPLPETWDVDDSGSVEPPSPAWKTRAARIRLYDELSQLFRPSTVPPAPDAMSLVKL